MADKYEIAKELTIALINKGVIRATDTKSDSSMNESLIAEYAKAYRIFFETIYQLEKLERESVQIELPNL